MYISMVNSYSVPSKSAIPFFVSEWALPLIKHQAYSNCAFSSTTPRLTCSWYKIWNFWKNKNSESRKGEDHNCTHACHPFVG